LSFESGSNRANSWLGLRGDRPRAGGDTGADLPSMKRPRNSGSSGRRCLHRGSRLARRVEVEAPKISATTSRPSGERCGRRSTSLAGCRAPFGESGDRRSGAGGASAPRVLARSDPAGSGLLARDDGREGPDLVGGDAEEVQLERLVRSCRPLDGAWRASSVKLWTRGGRAREGGCGGSPHLGQPANSTPRRSEKVKAGVLNQYGTRFAGRAL
jgi:hypothetical protein